MRKIIFVCTANMCRSPMAEGIFRNRLLQSGARGIEVESMGIYGRTDEPPVQGALDICRENGVDISGHRSRQLDIDSMTGSDVILTMEIGHLDFLRRFFHAIADRTGMLGAWPEEGRPRDNVKDPTGGSPRAYRQAFKDISRHIERILPIILDGVTS